MPGRAPLLTAASCVAAMALLALVALRTSAGSALDHAVLRGFVTLDHRPLGPISLAITDLGEPLPIAVACLALAGVAARRRDAWRAVAVATLPVVSAGSTVLLQNALATPRFEPALGTDQVGAAAFPSGHTTAAATVAACAVLVAEPAARRAAAIAGTAFAASMGGALLITGEHYPSDVLASGLLVGGWTCVALWALERLALSSSASRGPSTAHGAGGGLPPPAPEGEA